MRSPQPTITNRGVRVERPLEIDLVTIRVKNSQDREYIGIVQHAGHIQQPVAIGIRLDHRHHATVTGQRPYPGQVMFQREGIDARDGARQLGITLRREAARPFRGRCG